jgi:hypothetical protein
MNSWCRIYGLKTCNVHIHFYKSVYGYGGGIAVYGGLKMKEQVAGSAKHQQVRIEQRR